MHVSAREVRGHTFFSKESETTDMLQQIKWEGKRFTTENEKQRAFFQRVIYNCQCGSLISFAIFSINTSDNRNRQIYIWWCEQDSEYHLGLHVLPICCLKCDRHMCILTLWCINFIYIHFKISSYPTENTLIYTDQVIVVV